jgi:TonB family protein
MRTFFAKEATMAEVSLCYRDGMVIAKPCSDDEEDDGPGRVLTIEEFIERLRDRTDIFGVEKNYRLRKTELVTLLLAVLAGVWLSSNRVIKVGTDFYEHARTLPNPSVTVLPREVERFPAPAMPAKPAVPESDRKVLRKNPAAVANAGSAVNSGGVGSNRSRIVKMGVIGMLSGYVRGRDVADGDLFGKGGFTRGIDAILSGMGGLKQGGRTAVARQGEIGMGFGTGYGPGGGFGGMAGPDGVDDLINSLMAPVASDLPITFKTGPPAHQGPQVELPALSGKISGDGRKKSEIMRVVMQNITALRYAYNRVLREKPGLKGKVTIRFAIDEFGNVVHCDVVESSLGDKELEATVTGKIMRWKFDKIDKPGDITEVVYPFVFST